jgi:hypothetical protein
MCLKLFNSTSNSLIVNFPFICSNIPAAPAYVVYLSQLIRYFRACGFNHDFLDRGLLLTRQLPNQGFLLAKLKSSLRKFYDRHHDSGYVILVVYSFPHSWPITGFVTRLTQRMSLVEQELFALPWNLKSPPVLSEVSVTRSLVLCIMFYRSLFFLLFFFLWPIHFLSFFSIYRFWLFLWYHRPLLTVNYTPVNATLVILVLLIPMNLIFRFCFRLSYQSGNQKP